MTALSRRKDEVGKMMDGRDEPAISVQPSSLLTYP
jgi:hypothetical protein